MGIFINDNELLYCFSYCIRLIIVYLK